MNKLHLALLLIFSNICLLKSQISFFKDLNIDTAKSYSSSPKEFFNFNGTIFFSAQTEYNDYILMHSDGTPEGTKIFLDEDQKILRQDNGFKFASIEDKFVFVADNGKLWVSDGTSPGTKMIKNIYPGLYNNALISNFFVLDSHAFFTAKHPTSNFRVLMKTDGTTDGTVIVSSNSSVGMGSYFTVYNNQLFFVEGMGGTSPLWVINGHQGQPMHAQSGINYASDFFYFDSKLFFRAISFSADTGYELFYMDTLSNTAHLLKDMTPGSDHSDTYSYTLGDDFFYFQKTPTSLGVGMEIWKSDGTPNGTIPLLNTDTLMPNSFSKLFCAKDSSLYFSTYASNAVKIWKTSGNQTTLIGEYENATVATNTWSFENQCFFTFKQHNSVGTEIFKIDNITSEIEILKDINIGTGDGVVLNDLPIFTMNDGFYFAANDGNSGTELWKSDGTSAGTNLFKDIYKERGSYSTNFFKLHQKVYFSATKYLNGIRLFETDGTPDGTFCINEMFEPISSFEFFNGEYYLIGSLNVFYQGGYHPISSGLFKIDTLTNEIIEVHSTSFNNVSNFVNNGDKLFFVSGTSTIICFDGTNITSTNNVNFPNNPTKILPIKGGVCYTNASNQNTLWKYDGSTKSQLKPIVLNQSSYIFLDSISLFSATEIQTGLTETWISDGTTLNTQLFHDFNPDGHDTPQNFNRLEDELFFTVNTGIQARNLAKINLSSLQVENIINLNNLGTVSNIEKVIDGYYFLIPTSGLLANLYWTDGIDSVKYIDSNIYTFNNNSLIKKNAIDSLVYYVKRENAKEELWVTDGTLCGQRQLSNISFSQDAGGVYYILSDYADKLFFVANDEIHSTELWTYTPNNYVHQEISIESCSPYEFNGENFVETGNYCSYISSQNGIDTIYTINFSISNYTNLDTIQISSCSPFYWQIADTIISNSGIYEFIATSIQGCDSLVILNFQYTPVLIDTINVSTCNEFLWEENNQTYNTSGMYSYTKVGECDTFLVLNLSINYSDTNWISHVSCSPYYFQDADTIISNSGVYEFTTISTQGCDSIIILNFEYSPVVIDTLTIFGCNEFLWEANNQTYYSSGIYSFTNIGECDTLLVLNLSINYSDTTWMSHESCGDYVWIDGNIYSNSSNQISTTLLNQNGCDSIINLNLIIIPTQVISNNVFAYPSDFSECNGILFVTTTGIPNFTIDIEPYQEQISFGFTSFTNLCPGIYDMKTIDNCGDSLIQQIVIPVDSNYVFNNPFIDNIAQDSLGVVLENCEIYYNSIDTAYIDSLWLIGNEIHVIWNIIDQNGNNFDTTSYILDNGSGVYFLQLSIYCTNKILGSFFTVTQAIFYDGNEISLLTNYLQNESKILVFPNPASEEIFILFEQEDNARVKLIDMNGKIVFERNIYSGEAIQLTNLSKGVYNLLIQGNQINYQQKVIKI